MRSSIRSAAIALLVFACAAAFATSAAATPAPSESLVIFEGQLKGHQVSAVTLHTKAHTFRVLLTDGRIVRIAVPASEQQRLVGDIGANGITVTVAKAQSPSHKRRYIAAGVVIVAIVLAVGWLLLTRRRRRREE